MKFPFVAVAFVVIVSTVHAQARWEKMDYGPFLSASFTSSPNGQFRNDDGHWLNTDVTPRGIAIKLEDKWNAGVIFDCDAMRVSAGWIGGPLHLKGVPFGGEHGPVPSPSVAPLFQTPYGPGWADKNGSFKDPRVDTIAPLPPPGRLPDDWAKYRGLFRYGDQVVLFYTVGSCAVLESPGLETLGNTKAIARTIRMGATTVPLSLMIAETKGATGHVGATSAMLGNLNIALLGAPAGAKLVATADGQIHFDIPPHGGPVTFKVLLTGGGEAARPDFAALFKASPKPSDLVALTKGGPAKWTATIETKGKLGVGDGSYVVDTLTSPDENPYSAWMRFGGFDFFKDGTRAALSTWSGDVWIVSGIDDTLEHLTWKRFATGLHQPLGLKIVGENIYVVGHDQITRLHDLNNDGEADYYECFNNDWQLTTAFHAFAFDLHTDAQGNFYFAFGSPVHAGGGGFQKITADHGCILKISKDGSKMEHYAAGLRAPNGMCVSPTGQVTVGDNEGSYVPTSPLHWVKPGMFLGVSDSAHGTKVEQPKPLLWLSHNGGIDNSCGGQAWVTSDKWGPFKNYLLHMSYGQSSLFVVMPEEVNGQMQGGAFRLPVNFTSSAMRARFNARDGQLYVCGLRGWQTNAAHDGGFDRVRYTGKPVKMPAEMHVTDKGIHLKFTAPLDPSDAGDAESYTIEQWNYHWTSNYGSPEFSVADPNKQGHDKLEVKSAKVSADHKSVFLEVADLKPVMQMKIKMRLKAEDGTPLNFDIHNTINAVGTDDKLAHK